MRRVLFECRIQQKGGSLFGYKELTVWVNTDNIEIESPDPNYKNAILQVTKYNTHREELDDEFYENKTDYCIDIFHTVNTTPSIIALAFGTDENRRNEALKIFKKNPKAKKVGIGG